MHIFDKRLASNCLIHNSIIGYSNFVCFQSSFTEHKKIKIKENAKKGTINTAQNKQLPQKRKHKSGDPKPAQENQTLAEKEKVNEEKN